MSMIETLRWNKMNLYALLMIKKQKAKKAGKEKNSLDWKKEDLSPVPREAIDRDWDVQSARAHNG